MEKTSLDQKELLAWSKATLEKRARVRVSREKVQEETRYQGLEFHPVKRPVRVEVARGGDKKLITLTYPIEVQSTPVTQKQWVEIMGENPSHFAKDEDSQVELYGKDIELQPDNPVESVTWWSVLVFANRLSEQHGLPPAYDLSGITWESNTSPENGNLRPKWLDSLGEVRIYAKGKSHDPYKGDIYYQAEGYRLPTWVEQVYMLQRGKNMKGDIFKSKNDLDKHAYAWHGENSDDRTHPVALLQPMVIDGNEFYDLYGNVKELGWDKYALDLKEYSRKNPVGPRSKATNERYAVGGGFRNIGLLLDAHWLYPYSQSSDVGFRLVRTVKKGRWWEMRKTMRPEFKEDSKRILY